MTERPQDKSTDCGRAISDLKRYTWNELLNAFQVHDTFTHQGGPRFSWNNGQKGKAKRLARLDRFYIPEKSKLEITHKTYFIHGYPVGSDHAPVQMELHIGNLDMSQDTIDNLTSRRQRSKKRRSLSVLNPHPYYVLVQVRAKANMSLICMSNPTPMLPT